MSPDKLVAAIMLIAMMLEAGLELHWDRLLAALRDVGLLSRALLANFILVPLLGVLLARELHLENYIAIGFILMAIAPGVPFLVRAAGRQPGGSLGFAAELAFIMPALSFITIPITARLIFSTGLIERPDVAGPIPFTQILVPLVVFQLVPLVVGLLLGDRAPTLAGKLKRPLTLIWILAIVVLIAMLGPGLIKAIAAVYGSHGILAMVTLVLLSVGVGWLLGGPHSEYRRTLSIATALRNIGTCAVIATTVFPQTVVAPTVLTYLIVQFLITMVFRALFHRQAAKEAVT
jgi:bile acid:Na+ symporter, BASS family